MKYFLTVEETPSRVVNKDQTILLATSRTRGEQDDLQDLEEQNDRDQEQHQAKYDQESTSCSTSISKKTAKISRDLINLRIRKRDNRSTILQACLQEKAHKPAFKFEFGGTTVPEQVQLYYRTYWSTNINKDTQVTTKNNWNETRDLIGRYDIKNQINK